MKATIYSAEAHRGWLPWSWLAPFVCILLVGFSSVPVDLGLTQLGVTSESGAPLSAAGFCLMLILPFAAMGTAVLLWTQWVERRSLATLGLGGRNRLGKYLGGLLAGLATMGLAILLIWLTGGYRGEEILPAFASPVALFWVAMLLLCFLVQAGVEEFIFRGWLLSSIARRWNVAAGFIGSSAAFTFLHFSPHQPWRITAFSFVFALFACAWARRENGVWGVMGWHASWNWLGGVGFGVPITGFDVHLPALLQRLVPVGPDYLNGGPEGPEGSVLTAAMLGIATLAMLRRMSR